ncbi:MAG: carboxypeptidase regulatory-like domain-containing protein [Bacteroidales bacterium]|nr:carboxypeptidase regulatory-like domain-containing protein [Bacteroidales bacterium]
MKKFFKVVLLTVTTMIVSTVAYAQVTSSSIAGKITDDKGETVIGAAVIATHTPSGTVYGAVTNADGRYTIQGMRAGGPYTVEVSNLGYQSVIFNDIALQLGETYALNAWLAEASEQLSEAVVVASGDSGKTGAAQSIRRATIEEMPSITRGIADVTRVNPFVRTNGDGAMSIAGASNKYNSFQIDGAMNNDVFGLTSTGSNGGQAGTQPVSMETIEQVQVSIAPFDVRQSGFTGGTINAITKSGTNEFHGSVYGFGNNQSIIGNYKKANGDMSAKYGEQLEYQAGVTVGGPIVKDKLFFFASFEAANRQTPNAFGAGSAQSKVDDTVAQQVLDFVKAQSNNSYTGALPTDLQVYTKSYKATAKLDWNINDKNHASFRWSLVDAKQLNSVSSATYLNTTDYSYDFLSNTNSFVGELNSRIGNSMNNELRLSWVRVRDKRNPLGANFPMFQIGGVGDGTLCIGNERSSVANRLDQDIFSLTDNFSWYLGNHTLTFGTHNELYRFTNLFIQDKYGTYYFDSPQDLYDGKIKQYRYAHADTSVPGITENWEPTFWFLQLGLYAQDKWNVSDKFELTYGVRVDMPVYLSSPTENTGFTQYANEKGWELATNKLPAPKPVFSPRVGFRYDIAGNRKYVLRGGAGLFTGRVPFVWISNNYSNTGVQLKTLNIQRSTSQANADLLDQMTVIYDPAGQGANENLVAASAGSQVINVVDKNFSVPQNARFDLGFDFNLLGIDWTVEGIFTKTISDIAYTNEAYALKGNETFASVLPYDNRPMFQRITSGSPYANIYKLYSTSKGYGYNFMVQAAKSFDFGLDLNASYTYSKSKSVFNGGSSVAQSNFAYNYHHTNPNDPELANSAYNIPHQIKASAFYHISYGRSKQWTTTVGAVYVGTSGAAYSIYYNGDLNGDSSNGNDLIFIPTDEQVNQMVFKAGTGTNARFTPEVQTANYKQWLGSTRYLKDHRGQYFDRYADNLPFENHIDVHVGQKFGFRAGKHVHSFELTIDIINFTNMLNPAWGRSYGMGLNSYYSPVTYSGNGEFQFLHDGNYQMFDYADYLSRWRGQIGLKYTF